MLRKIPYLLTLMVLAIGVGSIPYLSAGTVLLAAISAISVFIVGMAFGPNPNSAST